MKRTPAPPRKSHQQATRAQAHLRELRLEHALLEHVPPTLLGARLTQALPVYSLDPPLPEGGALLARAARRIAWLYFLEHESHKGALEIGFEGGRHGRPRFEEGGAINGLLEAVRKARRRRGAAVRDAQLRLLRIHVLHLHCLWWHGKTDTIVPLRATAPLLEAGVDYPPDRFLKAAAKAAEAVLALHAKFSEFGRGGPQG